MAGFGNLGVKVVDGLTAQATGMLLNKATRFINGFGGDGKVKFYWDKDKGGGIVNVLTRSIVGAAASMVQQEAMDQYKKLTEKLTPKTKHTSSMTSLIEEGNKVDEAKSGGFSDIKSMSFGCMTVNKGNDVIVAVDCYGNRCADAIMLGIPLKSAIPVSQSIRTWFGDSNDKTENYSNSITSDHLVWWDCTAIITINSEKNLIATRVSGRDYSRKELVSNGDIQISVSGRINSNLPDVYPTSEIQKFIQIMNYKGIVRVNSQYLSQFGIDRLVIQNFNMPQKEGYKNLQEYSFSAIGMQPDKETQVKSDTITTIDAAIVSDEEEKSAWEQMLEDKVESIKTAGGDALDTTLATAAGMLDKIL